MMVVPSSAAATWATERTDRTLARTSGLIDAASRAS
jgi:hypothetical protein